MADSSSVSGRAAPGVKLPYLYVAGASYSGSTLLAFLLNAHPQMVSVSEVCGILHGNAAHKEVTAGYWCSCGRLLLDCPFYRDLEARIRDLGSDFDLSDWRTHFQLSRSRILQLLATRPLPGRLVRSVRDGCVDRFPAFNRARAQIAARNVHFARATLAISGKEIFVDASKDASRIRFLAAIPDIDLRVVHLVRDARGGTASFIKHDPAAGAATAVRRWMRANVAADRARVYVDASRWLRVRYDDLCSDYQATVDRIADFAGAGRHPVPERYGETEHHIVGNKMRRNLNRSIRLDESWKTRLSERDLEVVRRLGGGANRRFGFDWPADGSPATCAAPTRS